MLCPLLLTACLPHEHLHPADYECVREGCAWWDSIGDRCCIHTFAAYLGSIFADIHTFVSRGD